MSKKVKKDKRSKRIQKQNRMKRNGNKQFITVSHGSRWHWVQPFSELAPFKAIEGCEGFDINLWQGERTPITEVKAEKVA